MSADPKFPTGETAIISSLEEDAWHFKTSPDAYEWWYFDAVSDEGRDVVVITFTDNSVFSRGYNRSLISTPAEAKTTPGVTFDYYLNGDHSYSSSIEYEEDSFSVNESVVGCSIGSSSFEFASADYGAGYKVRINSPLKKGKRIESHFEWLSVESDIHPKEDVPPPDRHIWNIVCPRSDVTGRITVFDRSDRETEVVHFRGTGYHDHIRDERAFSSTISERIWGRAHFADSTVVFNRCSEHGTAPAASVCLVRDGRLTKIKVEYSEDLFVRDRFGIRYPTRIAMRSNEIILKVRVLRVLESSFYRLRFLCEFSMDRGNSDTVSAIGLSELIAPKTLKYRWLDWLNNLKVRRGAGK